MSEYNGDKWRETWSPAVREEIIAWLSTIACMSAFSAGFTVIGWVLSFFAASNHIAAIVYAVREMVAEKAAQ